MVWIALHTFYATKCYSDPHNILHSHMMATFALVDSKIASKQIGHIQVKLIYVASYIKTFELLIIYTHREGYVYMCMRSHT